MSKQDVVTPAINKYLQRKPPMKKCSCPFSFDHLSPLFKTQWISLLQWPCFRILALKEKEKFKIHWWYEDLSLKDSESYLINARGSWFYWYFAKTYCKSQMAQGFKKGKMVVFLIYKTKKYYCLKGKESMMSSLNFLLTCTKPEKIKLGKKIGLKSRQICALLPFLVARQASMTHLTEITNTNYGSDLPKGSLQR